jgi:alkyl sulfatase BDS1-like metallo-beta-lactamase superfamily hydrolase
MPPGRLDRRLHELAGQSVAGALGLPGSMNSGKVSPKGLSQNEPAGRTMRTIYMIAVASFALCHAPQFAHAAEPTPATIAANRAFAAALPWSDETEAELAGRGFVATRADPLIRAADGRVVMDLSAFDFAKGPAPASANPSLWRHLGLIAKHGLFKVAPRIWQVRGFDISVMTILETDTGFVIIDPLTTTEVAAAAMELVHAHVGKKPIRAVIYTHSHADHFGGVKGIVSEADVKAGKIAIVAPSGFMEHAVSENLTAGPAMSRRATYQFGTSLPRGPEGQAGAGIGAAIASGTLSLIAPTQIIERTGETLTIDGLRFEFQVTPGTEAPAEMNFFLPDLAALCLAENANVTMHNILPPRGALVRDSLAWASYLTESARLYGGRTQVLFNSHGWPRWGQSEIAAYVGLHRDAYKFLHDQSVRLMNKGLTAEEIAETIELPAPLAAKWYNRGYYGTMRHNSKAVYQRYLGWYDANPANLNPWPPEQAGQRYVAAMGGSKKALAIARKAYAAGDYRWAAEVASHIAFADSSDAAARAVLADAFTQMGYQAESMLWRNMYLTGAAEARATPTAPSTSTLSPDFVAAISTAQMFELLAIRVDPARATGKDVSVAFVFPERNERVRVSLRNSVLVQEFGVNDPVQATATMPRRAFLAMLFAGAQPASLVQSGALKLDGEPTAFQALLAGLDPPSTQPAFAIVTP